MRQKKFLLTLFIFFGLIVFAQDKQPIAEVQIETYTIKLVTNNDATYGYEIYNNNELQVKQKGKAYLKIPSGFLKKENALIIAKWEVSKLIQNRKDNEVLDIAKAKELGVTEEDLN